MIDAIDRRILHLLQQDARQSNKDLAAQANVSPSTMVNRIRSLEERNIIRGYHADVDPLALGRNVEAFVSVSLKPKNHQAVEQFREAMWALEQTVSISLLSGDFDFLVHLSDASVAALGDTVLSQIANAPNVESERTSLVFEHRQKPTLSPLNDPPAVDRPAVDRAES